MEYECVQCFREFETDPGEEPCEECRVENEARKKAWPHRVFDEDWDQCKASPGDWVCGNDTAFGKGCHECIIGQLAAQVAELEKRAVPEGWVPTEYVNGLIKVAISGTSRGRGWCVLENGDRRGAYASQWFHLNADGEPFDTPQAAIAAAEEASDDPPA